MARPGIEGEWVQSFIAEVEYFGAKADTALVAA